jgi:hypothetical protein
MLAPQRLTARSRDDPVIAAPAPRIFCRRRRWDAASASSTGRGIARAAGAGHRSLEHSVHFDIDSLRNLDALVPTPFFCDACLPTSTA